MNQIIFFSKVPGLADVAPIINARDYRPAWAVAARNGYKEMIKNSEIKDFGHIYQCPGIFDLLNQGFIVPMWHDLILETNGDKKTFRYQYPSDFLQDSMENTPIVHQHDELATVIPYPDNAMNIVVKFNTPWNVVAPKNLKFLILPLSYPDTYDFASVPGVLDPSVSTEINIQLFWYATNKRVYLKAGTPMMQIIPLTEKKYEMICRDKTKFDELWLLKKKFLQNFSWSFKRNIHKVSYENHYHKK